MKREQKPPLAPRPVGYGYKREVSLRQERLIGRAIIVWSKLESALQDTVWNFLGIDIEHGRVLTARMDAGMLIQFCRTLAETRIKEESKKSEFIDLMAKLEDRRADRNLIAHGVWGMFHDPISSIDGYVPTALSLRPRAADEKEVVSETFPIGRMCWIIQEIQFATSFLVDFLNERDPLRDKQRLEHLRS